ncbi:MAG: alpha/beta hydrolase [Gemmatimonadota bacterium]
MSITQRNNVRISGRGSQPMMFAHGFGCDQHMWRFVTPEFERDYRIVLFDHVGSGHSDLSAYRRDKYSDLQGYADDVLEICADQNLERVIFVGHSVSAMIGMLAAIREPDRFDRLVLIGPSPCYLNKEAYRGGFESSDLEELLDFMDSNFLGWAGTVAPMIMANADRPELPEELTNSFCRTDPEIARHFARVTFMSDNRADVPKVTTPSLVLQCAEDIIAPSYVGEYVHARLPNSRLVSMKATGHCPNLSAPQETIEAMQAFL